MASQGATPAYSETLGTPSSPLSSYREPLSISFIEKDAATPTPTKKTPSRGGLLRVDHSKLIASLEKGSKRVSTSSKSPRSAKGRQSRRGSDGCGERRHGPARQGNLTVHLDAPKSSETERLYNDIMAQAAAVKSLPSYPLESFSARRRKEEEKRHAKPQKNAVRLLVRKTEIDPSSEGHGDGNPDGKFDPKYRHLLKERQFFDCIDRHMERSCRTVKELFDIDFGFAARKDVLNVHWRSCVYPLTIQFRDALRILGGLLAEHQEVTWATAGSKCTQSLAESLETEKEYVTYRYSSMLSMANGFYELVWAQCHEKQRYGDLRGSWVSTVKARCAEFLGDLWRYRWQARLPEGVDNAACQGDEGASDENTTSSMERTWQKAIHWYRIGCWLSPNNGMTYHSIGVLYTALDIVRTMYYDCRSLSVSRPLHSSRDRMQQYLESMYRKCVEMFDGKLHPWMIKANGKSPGHAYLSPRFPKKKSGVRPAPPEAFAELFLVTDPALLDTSLSLVYMSLHRTLFTKIEIDHAITWARQAYIPLLLHCLRQPGYSPCGMPFMAASETSPAAEFAWNTEERGVMLAIIDLTSVVAFGRDPSDLVFATPPSLVSHERPPSLQETSGALQLDEMDDGTSLPIQVITAARVVAEIVYALTHFLLHECGDAASHEAIGVPSMDCQSVALTYLNTVLTFIVDPEGAERDGAQETPQKLRGKGKTPTLEPLVQKTRRYLRHLLLQWEGCMELLAKLCTVYASRDGDIPVTYEGIPSADLLPEDFGLRGVSYIRLSPAVRDPGPGGMPPIPTKDALVAARKRRFVRLALWFTDRSSILTSRSEASPPAIRGTKAAPEVAVEHGEIDQRPRPRSTSILADKLAATDEVADPDAEVRALAQRRSEGGGEEGDNVAGEYDNVSSLSESCDAEIQALKVQRETLQTLLDSQATNLRTKKRDRGIKKGPDRRQILRQIMADVDRRATVVVFDTNCFIDHLGVIKQTAEEDGWTLLVPLAIVMELEGLKRSGPPKRCSAAAKALGYIERGISAESDGGDEDPTDLPWTQARIKVVTAGGDVHHDLKFRSECYDFSGETSGYFSIDDVIIDACVRYGARQATKAGGGGKEGKEATPVVLVSLDRNLRIKSSTRNLTCLDLKQWRACAKSKR